ncbi:DNA/RNA polymerases superfamily protein [Cucumis melo var. makuwa]|uniref:DNA/RNA polymerases superfamily protein n=1 Tax=Cucumis melo var. makuwa TaxID=1194695 RepID=A0A5A7ULZ5_CUCMM|nr:DNA/RNA polymerases superfamily protein [Cucumis melo var. makuwa]
MTEILSLRLYGTVCIQVIFPFSTLSVLHDDDAVRLSFRWLIHCQRLLKVLNSAYAMHPGSTKMYRTLKKTYWWSGMKREIVEYVDRCLICQQVKPVRLPCTSRRYDGIWVIVDRLTKTARFIPIKATPTLDQLAKLYVDRICAKSNGNKVEVQYRVPSPDRCYQFSIGMAPFEALYGRPCRTPVCWNEVGERKLVVLSNRRRDLEFQIGEQVFLKLSPWRGVLRFERKGKLSPRYIGPYQIIERVGPAAYRLELPAELA